MLKKNKGTLIITSIVTLVPIIIGLALWNKLPEQVPFHWDINGNVDQWASRTISVFLMPAVLLAFHWLCVLMSSIDPKSKNYHPSTIRLVLWICPMISLLLSALVYTHALGYGLRVETVMPLFMGALFMVIGNLLPKMRQSYTMGIKLPWTLNNEENWNKTHRFAGKLWVAGGVVIMATAFLGTFWILLGILLLMVIIPTLYSYLQYRKHKED
ncbi:MAG: SdpI family protein [Oscillospiraceae bacterium]|nr:SdpI family protein [Oscillospiraceae bacterium]